MVKTLKFALILAFLLSSQAIFPQIKIIPLKSAEPNSDNRFFTPESNIRVTKTIERWTIYTENEPNKKVNASIPFVIDGADKFILETNLNLSEGELTSKNIKLYFLGINYAADIFINKLSIFKRAGGEIPFEIEIPKDILKADAPNLLTVQIDTKIDSRNTIPTQQRFLFPKNNSGVVREIYLELSPIVKIDGTNFNYKFNNQLTNADVNVPVIIKNFAGLLDESTKKEFVKVKINFTPKNFLGKIISQEFIVNGFAEKDFSSNYHINITDPSAWSPSTPNLYILSIELYKGTQLIDAVSKDVSFYSLSHSSDGLSLNNEPFKFKGTTYYLNESGLFDQTLLNKIKNDLTLIKNTGFNAVRFSKSYPHPYAIKLCQELGLISLIELPINSIPEEILSRDDFKQRATLRLNELTEKYSQYSNSIIWGLGSSFLPNSHLTTEFLQHLSRDSRNNHLYYASFVGVPAQSIDGVDLYGIEIYSTPIDNLSQSFQQQNQLTDTGRIFFSEVSYPNYLGSSSGYLVKNSSEAQAKYFENVISYAAKSNTCGFFINTFYNYSGDFNSLYAGSSKYGTYKLGILEGNPNLSSITYKVVKAKLNGEGKVTIPIGSSKDENKLFFILVALGLSVVMALLINSKKKFREDCTRALVRPYNFFADIRDHRILSGIHTIILSFIEVGSISLFFTIIFYYLRTNLLLEKLLLSFGDSRIINYFSFLAWNPEKSFIYLFILIFVKIFALTVIIKIASFFVRTRISLSSIFFMLIWALLPYTILLPVELIFYKILASGNINTFILIFLFLFTFWIFLRILRGIHVIFDTRPFPVYFYGFTLIAISVFSFFLYYHLTNSAVYYILNSIRQYQLMSF